MQREDVLITSLWRDFLRSLKQENVYPKGYETIRQARRGIYEYIETYNNQRLHSSIGYIPPMKLYIKRNEKGCLRK